MGGDVGGGDGVRHLPLWAGTEKMRREGMEGREGREGGNVGGSARMRAFERCAPRPNPPSRRA